MSGLSAASAATEITGQVLV